MRRRGRRELLRPWQPQPHSFDNEQRFDYTGLRGRLLSSSYVPEAGHPSYEPMLAALEQLFTTHQQAGQVVFEMDTKLYVGKVG